MGSLARASAALRRFVAIRRCYRPNGIIVAYNSALCRFTKNFYTPLNSVVFFDIFSKNVIFAQIPVDLKPKTIKISGLLWMGLGIRAITPPEWF